MGILSNQLREKLEEEEEDREVMESHLGKKEYGDIYLSLISKIPVGTLVHDESNIISLNEHCAKVLRGSVEELIGSPFQDILPSSQSEKYWRGYEEMMENGEGGLMQSLDLVRLDDTIVTVRSLGIPVQVNAGIVAQVVFMDQKRLQEILRGQDIGGGVKKISVNGQ